MQATIRIVFAALITLCCSAFAADLGMNNGSGQGALVTAPVAKDLVLEWCLETPANEQHLYREIGLSPCGRFLYVSDLWADAVLIFSADDPATPIGSFADVSWGKMNVFPYGVDVALDGMVYVSSFDYLEDGINDNALWRCNPDGTGLVRLCDLPEPTRGIHVSGAGGETVVYASGNYGTVMRCTPVSWNEFKVEVLFSTGVFRNQQDVVERQSGKSLYVSTWSHNYRDWYPDGPEWTPYESMITRWSGQGQLDQRFSVSYLPNGNATALAFNMSESRLYCFHIGFDPTDNEARIYKLNPITGKMEDIITIAPSGTSGAGGIDIGRRGEIYLAWSVTVRNGYRISALAKVRDMIVDWNVQNGAQALSSSDGEAVTVTPPQPRDFTLAQNYPNPFNPSTTITYELPRASHVSLGVFDVLGREVSVLVNDRREAGVHKVRFDGTGLPSGVYYYRLTAGDFVATRKLQLLK